MTTMHYVHECNIAMSWETKNAKMSKFCCKQSKVNIYCILCGWIKGFNRSITTLGSYRTLE